MKNGIKKLALLLLSFSISYADLVTVERDITTDVVWTADNPAPCLVVEQGGKVMAQGTVDAPITFRSELSEDDPNYGNGRGLWGGLIINGYAPIANEGGTAVVEGLTGVLY